MHLLPVLHAVLEEYTLPQNGCHGVAHWARVLENGQRLAAETGADVVVVSLFAVLHDSCRINEGIDPEHEPRAAEFAAELRGRVFNLDDHDFQRRYHACEGHTHKRTHPDVTIQTCWDSDRLDLGRVGILPRPDRLCTDFAKRPETIEWANGRASVGMIPALVPEVWGIHLKQQPAW